MTDDLPDDTHIDAARASTPIELHADVVIVGLGAGGGMVFDELSRAGLDVVGLDMGGRYDPDDNTRREEQMLPELFQESGARTTDDFAVNILQGKGIGGSTIHNTNLCKRLDDRLLDLWAQRYGLSALTEAPTPIDDDFDIVEQRLDVHRVPDHRVNANNQVISDGLDALDWDGGRLKHNRDGCQQSGFCELGCPNDGKQNAAKVLIPSGRRAGGRIVSHVRATDIQTRNGRATGVKGVVSEGANAGNRVQVTAEAVCLAASATGSAALTRRSDVPDPYDLVGSNLHMHPGATVIGLFDREIKSWKGNPQSVECTEFLEIDPASDKRAWIVAGAAHPGGAANFVPGFGRSHGRLMREYPNMASLIVMLHDHSSGLVSPGDDEQVHVDYQIEPGDWRALAEGLRAAGKLLLAGGARQVVVPLNPPVHARDPSELGDIHADRLGPLNPPLAAVHPMSTMWMGTDPGRSVVAPNGAYHHLDDLYVADGSLFPTSIGGPPQIPIYTFGRRIARTIARRFGGSLADA
jgi:choline dehydrogenase-like flavoprotein